MTIRLYKGAEYLVSEATRDDVYIPEFFTDEQKQIGKTIEQFITNDIDPHREEIENQNFSLTVDLLHRCGELGILMIDVPAEFGGLELDKTTSMHAAEKMAPSGSFFVTSGVTANLGSMPLIYYGTHEQKMRYLPKLATGEFIGAYCLTEPDSGSDALGAKTTATLSADGNHYTLNGTKQFITNGSIADLFTVFAKIDKEYFTAFLVEKGSEGLSVGAEEKKLGIKGSSTTQVIFDNVVVPAGNLLGEIGKGHKIAFNILTLGRLKVASGTMGTAKAAFSEGVAYSNLRKQFKVPISSFGAMKEKIADMAAAIFASESLIYRITGQIDTRLAAIPKGTPDYYEVYQQGIEEYTTECSIAKVFCSEVLADVADEVVQIHGGYGFIQEYPAERYYRDERINRIFEGTNEINRMLITTQILRRVKSGLIQLSSEVATAREAFSRPGTGSCSDNRAGAFAAEKNLVANMKRVYFILLDAALNKYREAIKDEQEILMALADVAITIFAIESAVLRADKILPDLSDSKMGAIRACVQVFTFNSAAKSGCAIRKAANYIAGDDNVAVLSSVMYTAVNYDPPGLLQAKRRLADASIEREKYIF